MRPTDLSHRPASAAARENTFSNLAPQRNWDNEPEPIRARAPLPDADRPTAQAAASLLGRQAAWHYPWATLDGQARQTQLWESHSHVDWASAEAGDRDDYWMRKFQWRARHGAWQQQEFRYRCWDENGQEVTEWLVSAEGQPKADWVPQVPSPWFFGTAPRADGETDIASKHL